MLDDGSAFTLLPWRLAIEPYVGQSLSAVVPDRSISWEVGPEGCRSEGMRSRARQCGPRTSPSVPMRLDPQLPLPVILAVRDMLTQGRKVAGRRSSVVH